VTKITGSRFDDFFTFTINYSTITNLHNSLRHAPFSSLYSQVLKSKRHSLYPTNLRHRPRTENTSIAQHGCPVLLSSVSTHALPSNEHPILHIAYSLLRDVLTGLLPSNGCPSSVGCALVGTCLPIRFLETAQSGTALKPQIGSQLWKT
jgi:hypothetical protein